MTKSKSKPTPTPWVIYKINGSVGYGLEDSSGNTIATANMNISTVKTIVRAVNSHEEIVKTLYELMDRLLMGGGRTGMINVNEVEINMIKAAILKAEKGE